VFEKLSDMAEQAATSASRRQFLGRFGRGALAVAAVLGGWCALPSTASAGGPCPRGTRPVQCPNGTRICCPTGQFCSLSSYGYWYCRTPGGGNQ
jgi:hypothetical protein